MKTTSPWSAAAFSYVCCLLEVFFLSTVKRQHGNSPGFISVTERNDTDTLQNVSGRKCPTILTFQDELILSFSYGIMFLA